MKRLRILAIYSTDRLLGGGEFSFTFTLQTLQAAGHDVLAVVPADGPLSAFLSERKIPLAIAQQESFRAASQLPKLIWPAADWVRVIEDFRPDLIHCNAIRSALFGQAAGRRFDIPVLLHARKEYSDPLDPFLMLTMQGVICISEVVRKRFAHLPGSAILKVIYNMVDPKEFENAPNAESLRRQWLRSPDDVLVGLPSRLSPIKGQLRLVHAARRVVAECPNARFVLMGEEDDSFPGFEASLKQEIQAAGLESRFVFAGFQSDMPSAYRALDLVVFPTSAEAFGRIVIEAGAAHRPLITNDIDVMREILPTDSPDFSVDCDDANAFAARIIYLLRQPEAAARAAERLSRHVRETFGAENHLARILEMYKEVLV